MKHVTLYQRLRSEIKWGALEPLMMDASLPARQGPSGKQLSDAHRPRGGTSTRVRGRGGGKAPQPIERRR